ncbi:MAG: threonine--tRNA ligase [Candidatus Levybacteria bacterium]|nr:threonine--tRNA ligase [Candidatus Levybacteria bacterium]
METNFSNLRHSTAHLLAAAVLRLYPEAKLTIGPAIDNGFYYDIEFPTPITDSDLPAIEKMMQKTLDAWDSFTSREVSEEEARKIYQNNPYKLELIDEIVKKGEKITLFKAGMFEDLCRGGHVDNPAKEIEAFKLLSIAGAYWRGDEKNKMLTRIYGTSFPTQQELDLYVQQLEEAKKRDHRRLGQELDLFTFSELVGKGLPLFTPKGTMLRELLNDFSQRLRIKRGYQKVWVPHITKKELYETSGHWTKFGNELFLVTSQETDDKMVMKPMNCPHHQQIYASKQRSYRDLPIKYLETTTIYRDEKAGELMGLSRVRSVTQDDSHAFCTPEQIHEIYQSLIEITKEFYEALDMNFRARLSFRDPQSPEKYLGEDGLWNNAQEIILNIAKENNLDYYVAEGEAAFYGPKIDFMVSDALGREWQLATPQLDFVQPKRFGLTYIDSQGIAQTPVMIHFALMGSIERFLSVYIEHTAGKFPLWLAPVQVQIIPVSEKFTEYAKRVVEALQMAGLRVEVDFSNNTLGAKIREATLQKVPFMCIIGGQEEEKSKDGKLMVSVRARDGKDLGMVTISEFINQIQNDIETKH